MLALMAVETEIGERERLISGLPVRANSVVVREFRVVNEPIRVELVVIRV